jgi:hypothetical protein
MIIKITQIMLSWNYRSKSHCAAPFGAPVSPTLGLADVIKVGSSRSMRNVAIIILGFIVIVALFIWKVFFGFTWLTESILCITAFIVFWYTCETHLIRKANNEILFKAQRPVVGYSFFTNDRNPLDTRFTISNLSDYRVAALVKCTFKSAGKTLENIWPGYKGNRYWNLQYRESKEGHFSLLSLYQLAGYFDQDQLEDLRSSSLDDIRDKITNILIFKYNLQDPPKLTMEVEVYCTNYLGQSTFYPTTIYRHDPFRMVWIPTLTDDKPYWKLDQEPKWVKESRSELNES